MNLKVFLLIFFLLPNSIFCQVWQGSLDNNDSIKLRIRSKYGAGAYIATFVVRTESVKYTKRIHINGSDFGTVEFPKDFLIANHKINIESPRKYYEWRCMVNNKPILYGSFFYPNFVLKFYGEETTEEESYQNLEKIDSENLSSGYVTLSDYYRIKTGMGYDEVVGILGKSYKEMSRSEFLGVVSAIYVWRGRGFASMLQIIFTDWEVVSKSQFGLE